MELFSIRRITMMRETQEYVFGYIDKEECFYQHLCKSMYIFGFRLFWWSYFEEKVPNWAVISYRCFGSTDWKSKNPSLIDYHSQNIYIFRIEINNWRFNCLNGGKMPYNLLKFQK